MFVLFLVYHWIHSENPVFVLKCDQYSLKIAWKTQKLVGVIKKSLFFYDHNMYHFRSLGTYFRIILKETFWKMRLRSLFNNRYFFQKIENHKKITRKICKIIISFLFHIKFTIPDLSHYHQHLKILRQNSIHLGSLKHNEEVSIQPDGWTVNHEVHTWPSAIIIVRHDQYLMAAQRLADLGKPEKGHKKNIIFAYEYVYIFLSIQFVNYTTVITR